MSTKCLFRAIKAKVGSAQRKLVLITLCDIANEKSQCWPSHQYISDRAECSKRSVISHLSALENLGFISVKNRADDKGKSTSNLYTILNFSGVQELHPSGEGVKQLHGEGEMVARGEGEMVAHNTTTLLDTPIDTPKGDTTESLFDRFYENYPRRTNRKKALAAWKKINPSAEDAEKLILDCNLRVQRGAWCPDTAKSFIPHPTTYLNGEGWQDEIVPRADFRQPTDFSAIARNSEDFIV